jgi:hypothetical protein
MQKIHKLALQLQELTEDGEEICDNIMAYWVFYCFDNVPEDQVQLIIDEIRAYKATA